MRYALTYWHRYASPRKGVSYTPQLADSILRKEQRIAELTAEIKQVLAER